MGQRRGMLRQWFLPYFKKHKGVVALDLFCAALTTLNEIVLPMLVRRITAVALDDFSRLTLQLVLTLAAVYGVLKLVDVCAGYYMIYVGHTMGVMIERDMREDLFAHLLRVPFSYYDNTKVGQLMARITTDLFDIAEFSHHCPEEFFIFGIKICVSFGFLCTINLPLTAAAFVLLPFMFFGTMYFRRKMRKVFKARREIAGDVNAKTENALLGIRVVKSFSGEGAESAQFNAESARLAGVQRDSYRYMARLNAMVRLFDGLMYVVMLFLGGVFVMKKQITTADYTAYFLYVAMLIAAIKRIVEFTEQFEKGMTGIERFAEVMTVEPEPGYDGALDTLDDVKGEIVFSDVTFSYDKEKGDVLEHLNLTVQPGENVAVVGPSGSGKTTMCSLISRFYDLSAGEITLDGRDIRSLNRRDAGRDPQSSAARRRGRIHRKAPAAVRHLRRRTRRDAVRRPEAAHLHCARVPQKPAGADSGRGDQLARQRERTAGSALAARAVRRPYDVYDRPPSFHDPQRVAHSGADRKRDRGRGHARRTAEKGRRVRKAVPGAGITAPVDFRLRFMLQ